MNKSVALAISGGIDSAISAYFLKDMGYDVLGIHFNFWKWSGGTSELLVSKNNLIDDIKEKIGIQIRVQDYSHFFSNTVVDDFLSELSKGLTPNPCVICNPLVKFRLLEEIADKERIDHISTGHYARVEYDQDGYFKIKKGIDTQKDQSYMLCYLNQKLLSRIIFPLGDRDKKDIKKLGKKLGLKAMELKESQDLCFVDTNHYKQFISSSITNSISSGDIVNTSGKKIGQHEGLAFYTIGQRKGIKISAEKPYYVMNKDIKKNQLIVGYLEELGGDEMVVINPNWIHREPKTPFPCDVKIRYRSPYIGCIIEKIGKKTIHVKLSKKLRDITPGQYAVFYTGDELLGGGKISRL